MTRKFVFYVSVLLLLLLGGCNDEVLEAEMPWNDPAVRLMKHTKVTDDTYNRPAIILEFMNQGDITAYNTSYSVELKKGNTIIYTRSGIVAGGRLDPGESAVEDVLLSKLQSHNEYQLVEVMLYYSDIADNYYTESYGF
jgi:hypothetical protein